MSVNFSKTYPWSGIKSVTIDGQDMVKIPKFYFRSGQAPEGAQYEGKQCYWISETPRKGFHVYPAFVRNGKEMDCFYIGAYEGYEETTGCVGSKNNKAIWTNTTFYKAKEACEARNKNGQIGWHMQNIYERTAISFLMLIERRTAQVDGFYASGNCVRSTGAKQTVWRGIHEWANNYSEFIDGLKVDKNGDLMIFSNQGDNSYSETGIQVQSYAGLQGWIVHPENSSGMNFNLKDVPITVSPNRQNPCSAFGEQNLYFYGSNTWITTTSIGGDVLRCSGVFSLHTGIHPDDYRRSIAIRLAKYGELS